MPFFTFQACLCIAVSGLLCPDPATKSQAITQYTSYSYNLSTNILFCDNGNKASHDEFLVSETVIFLTV